MEDKKSKLKADAVKKHRRQKTLAKKMCELALIRGCKINLIIYDPKVHKVEEFYTDQEVDLASINQMIANPKEPPRGPKVRRRYLKFNSFDVKKKYNLEELGEIEDKFNIDDLLTSQPSETIKVNNKYQSTQNDMNDLIKSINDSAIDLQRNNQNTHLNIPSKLDDILSEPT